MKLRAKVLLTIIAIWGLIIGGTYLGANRILEKSYSNLEQKQIQENLLVLNETIQALQASNAATISSWTNWDLLYEHMKTKQSRDSINLFFNKIVNPGALSASNVDIYLTFNAQGIPHFFIALSPDRANVAPLPKEIVSLFDTGGELRKLIVPADINSDVSGLISISNNILILGSHRILTSSGQGSSLGTAIVFTYLNENIWKKVREDSKLDIQFYGMKEVFNSPILSKVYKTLLTNKYVKINFNENTVNLYTALTDLNKKPIGVVKVAATRTIHLLGKSTIYYFNLIFVLIGLVFSLVLFYLLKFLVIDRLAEIKDDIVEITTNKNFKMRVPCNGSDEIASLGLEINKTLKLIDEIETLLTSTINFMPSIMLITDKQLKISNFNYMAQKIAGISLENAKDKLLFDVFPYLEKYKDIFNLAMKGEVQEINQIECNTKQATLYYKAVIYPLRQSDENNLVIRLDNITERLQISQILMQQDRLSSIGLLTAGVAHEINNPMNFIFSSLGPLKANIKNLYMIWQECSKLKELGKDELSEKLVLIEKLKQDIEYDYTITEINQLFDGMNEGINRTAMIMHDLKAFYKGSEELMHKANIHAGIDMTLTLLKVNYQDRINIHKKYGAIPEIDCFYGKLNQVFMNILVNAIEAIPNHGDIEIKTEKINNNVIISIKDNGIGIPEVNLKKIFDPFYTTKEVGKGTGLGLSIVSSIIRDHDGHIEVKSGANTGAQFIITLPIINAKNNTSTTLVT